MNESDEVMEVSPEQFYRWKHDPVTVALMNKLRYIQDHTKDQLSDPELIRDKSSSLLQRECLGWIDSIDYILNITLSDLYLMKLEEE